MGERSGYAAAVVKALQTAEGHIDAEYRGEIDGVMASITSTPRYAFMPEPGRIAIITDPKEVRQFYVDAREDFTPMASRMLTHVGSDWYDFQENVPTRKLLPSGTVVTLNNVVLFPRSADGIQGEILWDRYPEQYAEDEVPWVDPELGAVDGLPLRRLRNAKLHDAFLTLVRQGKTEEIGGLLEDGCLRVVRNYLDDAIDRPMAKAEGRAAVLEQFDAWGRTFEVEGISVLQRLVTDWYVFAEELYTVRHKVGPATGQRHELRRASVYAIGRRGLVLGELGYGTELAPVSVDPNPGVGRVSWVRVGGYVDDMCLPPTGRTAVTS